MIVGSTTVYVRTVLVSSWILFLMFWIFFDLERAIGGRKDCTVPGRTVRVLTGTRARSAQIV